MGARGQRRCRPSKPSRRFRPRRARRCPPRGRWSPRRSRWPRATAPRAIRELDIDCRADARRSSRRITGGCAARRAFLTGHPVEGTRAFVERERYLATRRRCAPAATELFALIRDAAERGASLKAPPKTDPIVAGWLALGPVAVDMARNPTHAAAALDRLEARPTRSIPPTTCVLTLAQKQIAARHPVSRSDRAAAAACRAAPRRSALRCATDSSRPICSRMPPRARV